MAGLSESAELGDCRADLVCAHAHFDFTSAGICVVVDGLGVRLGDGVERNRYRSDFVAAAVSVPEMWRGFYAQGALG